MRLKKRLRLCGMLLATCFLLVMKLCGGMTLSTSALGKLDINDMLFYGNSGIYYYWPCDRVGSGGMDNCTAITGANITWIGDSYSTGAKSEIESVLPGISFGGSVNDANSTIQACKFVSADTTCNANPTNPSGFEVLKKVIETGELKSYLVFALGTNGGWTSGDANTFKSIMEQAKGTKVVFVTSKTPGDDYAESNKILKDLADSDPNYMLADWTTVYEEGFFVDDPEKIHPTANGGYEKWVEVIYNTLPRCTGGAGDGDFSRILTAKNADKSYFNHSGNIDPPAWSDTDPASMKALLENYGDLAYQLGLATGAPWVAILTQLRYEDAYSVCGKNNFWGNGCPPGTPAGGASIQGENLGEGFKQYGETLLNTSLDGGATKWYAPALEKSDPKEYLRALGPRWVQGAADGPGYAHIKDMEKSIDALTNYINSSEGQAIVKTFGNYYYNGGVNSGNSSGGSSLNTSGTVSMSAIGEAVNYAGDTIFTEDELKKIAEYQPVYEEAVKEYGIPWQILPILHNNENSLGLDNPSNGQGLYQFYTQYMNGEHFPSSGTADEAEFLRQSKMAAADFAESIKSAGYDVNSEKGIKYGFFAYNGTADYYKTQAINLGFSAEEAEIGEGSPYVMNRYDAARDPTVEPTKSNGTWMQFKCDPGQTACIASNGGSRMGVANSFFGAYVQFVALTGGDWSSTGGLSGCGEDKRAGNGGELIAEVSRELAWPDKDHYGQIKPAFADAARKVGLDSYATELSLAQDCGHFVSVVVRTAVDPDFPEGGTPNMETHMHESSLWEEIENLGNESNLKPGDVFVANTGSGGYGSGTYPSAGMGGGGHILIYLGGSDITSSASLYKRTGNLGEALYFTTSYATYRIFRSTVSVGSMGGTVGSFDEGLKAIEASEGIKVGAAVTEPGNKDSSVVQVGGSWPGGRAWSTIKVPLAIAATQKNASTGRVEDPYGGKCNHSLDSAIRVAITQSDNCGAWWLWTALGGDNSSAAETVTSVIKSGGDPSTTVNGSGDGNSLTSGKTNWSLVGQALFAANMSSISGSSNTMTQMKTHNASDGTRGINIFVAMSKGGWGNDGGTSATRQFGIIKLSNGKCSAIAIGTDAGSNFTALDKIANVIKQHQDDIPSGSCPAGL